MTALREIVQLCQVDATLGALDEAVSLRQRDASKRKNLTAFMRCVESQEPELANTTIPISLQVRFLEDHMCSSERHLINEYGLVPHSRCNNLFKICSTYSPARGIQLRHQSSQMQPAMVCSLHAKGQSNSSTGWQHICSSTSPAEHVDLLKHCWQPNSGFRECLDLKLNIFKCASLKNFGMCELSGGCGYEQWLAAGAGGGATAAERNATDAMEWQPELHLLPEYLDRLLDVMLPEDAEHPNLDTIHLAKMGVIFARLPWDPENVYMETVRANPWFHYKPFFDRVRIESGEEAEGDWFGELLAMFNYMGVSLAFVRFFTTDAQQAPVPAVMAPLMGLLTRLGVVHLAWESINNAPSYGVVEMSSIIRRESIVPDCHKDYSRAGNRFLLNPFLWAM